MAGYDANPEYTYAVDLTRSKDDLLMTFSSDARSNVRNTDDDAYTVEVGDTEEIRLIYDQVRRRYESQGISFGVPLEFVTDLAERAENGHVRPYTLRVDGEFVGGILALEYGPRTGRWMGGVRTDADVDVPTNDLLDWAIMEDGIDSGLERYDLVGADTRRINRYKSKFNPGLETYYSLEYGSWECGRRRRCTTASSEIRSALVGGTASRYGFTSSSLSVGSIRFRSSSPGWLGEPS